MISECRSAGSCGRVATGFGWNIIGRSCKNKLWPTRPGRGNLLSWGPKGPRFLSGQTVAEPANKEGNVLFNNTFYLWLYGVRNLGQDNSDSNLLLPIHRLLFLISSSESFISNNTFYLWLCGVRNLEEDHSDSKRGNLLLPNHWPLFPISSKGSFMYTILQTGYHKQWALLHYRGTQAGIRNSSMGLPSGIILMTMSRCFTTAGEGKTLPHLNPLVSSYMKWLIIYEK